MSVTETSQLPREPPRGRPGTTYFACAACGATSLRWVGRCTGCGEWNTFTEAVIPATRAPAGGAGLEGPATQAPAVPLAEVSTAPAAPLPSGVSELDRVLGGGVVRGSVTLLYGPPGIGKSTLLFQVLASVAQGGRHVLLASAEESLGQVIGRAARIGPVPPRLLGLEGPDVEAIESAVLEHRPALVVVDSLQSVSDPGLPQSAGSLAQVRACVERMTRLAKSSGVP